MKPPRLVSIAPNLAFLDTLAGWWLRQCGWSGDAAGRDPMRVADAIFILPTRRAARGLADALLAQAGGQPLLLPRILALGGVDEAPLALHGALDLPPAVPEATRLAVLTRFILAMNGQFGAPSLADRAWALAVELAALLDEAARAEIDLAAALPGAVGAEFAAHWNVTLRFLEVVTHRWPAWLAEAGLADVAARQIALLEAQRAGWAANPPDLPVIAAGSTGAIPAVARLLKLVAHLPRGLVVLPGLDLDLDEAGFAALEASHPQASLRALLVALDARRADVQDWPAFAAPPSCAPPSCTPARLDVWRRALLPAAALGQWQIPAELDLSGLTLLEPADQQEEAAAIALLLRDALSQPQARAALVTPDRALARRVAAELLRFGVVADDSAGEKLGETPPAVFLRLLADAVAEDLRPVKLLALLKHPFCAAGLAPARCRDQARALELAALRGPRPAPGLEALREAGGDAGFLDRLAIILGPLLALRRAGAIPVQTIFTTLIAAAEALAARDDAPGAAILWAGEEGEALARHLAALHAALPLLPAQDVASLPGLLEAVLAGAAVRSRRALRGRAGAEHPRIFIWGLLEARLQSADLMVLGGLSEGLWPPMAESGPWMNRAMRAAVGLPSPELQIGLAAHDFVMAGCAAPGVVLSSPRRRDGAPCVPSRWLVRLEAMLAGQQRTLPRHPAVQWAQALDRPAEAARPVSPPAPAPPVARRPRTLSVTRIETWLADPYAIYASHILRLRKLPPLEESADAADYGSIVHRGLQHFFSRNQLRWPADAAHQLEADMHAALDEAGMRPALASWWRPRLQRIAAWVAAAERDRRGAGWPRHLAAEQEGRWEFDAPAGPFTLTGRADRIEQRADGRLAILDYKTGTPPSAARVQDGRAPQLPLEATIARQGGFGADWLGETGELTYWHISGGAQPGQVITLFKGDAALTRMVVDEAEARLRALVAAYDDPHQPYLSQPTPGAAPRFSDYALLARVAEWAMAEED